MAGDPLFFAASRQRMPSAECAGADSHTFNYHTSLAEDFRLVSPVTLSNMFIAMMCMKACPPSSQPPDHDRGNVGNCDHHCGDHGLIEKSDGRGSARGIVQSAIRLCVD